MGENVLKRLHVMSIQPLRLDTIYQLLNKQVKLKHDDTPRTSHSGQAYRHTRPPIALA